MTIDTISQNRLNTIKIDNILYKFCKIGSRALEVTFRGSMFFDKIGPETPRGGPKKKIKITSGVCISFVSTGKEISKKLFQSFRKLLIQA